MGKLDFIREATELYRMQSRFDSKVPFKLLSPAAQKRVLSTYKNSKEEILSVGVDWLGPYMFRQASCANWAVCGAVEPRQGDLSVPVLELQKQGWKNTKPERREMVRHMLKQFGLKEDKSLGNDQLAYWSQENQLFIASTSATPPHEQVAWTHWWIEIRNIVVKGWTREDIPRHLLLEKVPGRQLTVRAGEHMEDYLDSGDWSSQVAVPVEDLSQQHYEHMQTIRASMLLFPQVNVSEDEHEYLKESGLDDTCAGVNLSLGHPSLLRINLNEYQRPALRDNAPARFEGSNCQLVDPASGGVRQELQP